MKKSSAIADGLPLWRYRDRHSPVLLGPRRNVGAGEMLSQAARLARALPDCRYAINVCESRHGFMLALIAAMTRGQVSLLPPAPGKNDQDALLRDYPDACVLSEARSLSAGARHVDVAPYLEGRVGTDEAEIPTPRFAADAMAAILFTSGSTGRPSAHPKRWGQLCQGSVSLAATLDWAPEDVCVVGSVQPQHMFGLETTVMLPWMQGCPVYGGRPLLGADLGAALRRVGRRCWWMTTPALVRSAEAGGIAMDGLDGVIASTASLPVPLAVAAEARWRAPMLEIYGSTETGALAIRRTAGEHLWSPLPGIMLSPGNGGRQNRDEPNGGEQSFVMAHGGHVTGDGAPVRLADELRFSPDGRFEWLGRSSDLVKVGGKRASLAALNQILLDIPGVDDGVVFLPQPMSTQPPAARELDASRRVAALYVSATLAPGELMPLLRDRFDVLFLPRPLLRVAKLPRDPNGKLPAAALADLYSRCRVSQPPASATAVPRTHPSLVGHFPGCPIVPGVLILEQVAAQLRRRFPNVEPGILRHARFHAPLPPEVEFGVAFRQEGERIHFEVRRVSGTDGGENGGRDGDQRGGEGELIASGCWLDAAKPALKPKGGESPS